MCTFNATELLAERRELASSIQPDADHDANVKAYDRIRQIDALRLDHEERTACDCWLQARKAASMAGAA